MNIKNIVFLYINYNHFEMTQYKIIYYYIVFINSIISHV